MTKEVYSGDVTLQVRADVGDASVYGSIHGDLGTSSLYFAGVSRDGRCEIGRKDYGLTTEFLTSNIGPLPGTDVQLELRSNGEMIESRVWLAGSERPEKPTALRCCARVWKASTPS